jgi:dipeptidyl aminopeptidase/acylaminoacyl peptidase
MKKILIPAASIVCLAAAICCAQSDNKIPITVDDAIAMTRLAEHRYFQGATASDVPVAYFSPNQKQFVIILRKGNLTHGSNEYTMYLLQSDEVLRSPQPIVALKIESTTNSPAMSEIKWLGDNRTIAFLGAEGDAAPEVYSVDTQSGRLSQRTFHTTAVRSYDISADGQRIVFAAEPARQDYSRDLTEPLLIQDQYLSDLLLNRWREREAGLELFVQESEERKVPLPDHYILASAENCISVSGDGRYSTVIAEYRRADPSWVRYQDANLQRAARERSGVPGVKEILLLDTSSLDLKSVFAAPAPSQPDIRWAPNNTAFTARSFLPIGNSETSLAQVLPVEVEIPDLKIKPLSEDAWNAVRTSKQDRDLRITLKEDINTPPRIYAQSISQDRKSLLMDLNPQFDKLEFGMVESLELSLHGVHVLAGVYFPPHYSQFQRYPLVIQTHGFDTHRFSMDGQDEWSTGYAARPLAASGFVVLQIFSFKTDEDAARYLADATLGRTPEERAKVLYLRVCEAAIDALDRRGLIDRSRIGISGFSVTVMFVGYILTHSSYSFAAAVLSDGVDGNYCQYLESETRIFEQYNGGASPFTPRGLSLWIQGSPGFHLGSVHAPVRLVALKQEDILEMWEWFSALKMQGKAVELIKLPESAHLMERTTDRKIAMDGLVDWFRFWLEGEEDQQPAKPSQYARWESMKASGLGRTIGPTEAVGTTHPLRMPPVWQSCPHAEADCPDSWHRSSRQSP